MTPFRAETQAKIIDQDRIAVTTSSRRRIIYGLIALVLFVAAAAGFDPAVDFSRERLLGTVFIFLLFAGSLFIAGYRRTFLFDKTTGSLTYHNCFFSINLKASVQLTELSLISRIQFTDIQLLRGTPAPHAPGREDHSSEGRSGRTGRFRIMEHRAHLYQLFVETREKKILIQESTYPDELENSAGILSKFLGIPVNRQATN
jgi:hypothetical protein